MCGIVIRTNGTEEYVRKKVSAKTAENMIKAGHFTDYNAKFGYVEGDYKSSRFEYRGVQYKIEYFSGCFNPFLLQLIKK